MSGVAIAEWSEQTPEHTAVIAHGTPYSYRFLARFLLALRSRLEAENLARGSLVVLCVRSTFRGWLGVMALRSLGVATITLREPRMLEVLGLRQPAAILVWEEETWDLAPLERAWPDLRVITIPSNIPRPQGRQRADARTLLAQRAPHLLFSSGTTGAFKMVALDGPQEAEVARLRAETYGFGQSTVFDILNFGLWTAAGFKFPIAVWAAGGTVVRPGHPVPITRVKGRGKWQIVERDAKGTRPLVEFRLKQPGEPDITWVARPAGRGAMYHRTRDGSGDTVLDIEAACGKLG